MNETRNNKKSRRNNKFQIKTWYMLAGGLSAVILIIIAATILFKTREDKSTDLRITQNDASANVEESQDVTLPQVETQVFKTEEETAKEQEEQIKQEVIAGYENLGVALASGYINIRDGASVNSEIIGKLQQYAACEIIESDGEWYRISSGGLSGYVHSQYVLTGEEAVNQALENVKLRAIIKTDKLNIRSEPVINPENVVGQVLKDERYEVFEEQDGWLKIKQGFISSEFVEVRSALNEARKLDLKAMALSQYDNPVVSKVNNYLNIRSSPEDQGNKNIVGKMPGRAAAEILETENGWYKIRSGNITGYISADSQYTAVGQEARDLAAASATMMAIVNTDMLNVRTEPSTESSIWTQISKEERYAVVEQLDGWVQIEMDSGEEGAGEVDKAFLSTRDNNVEVRYALTEAIKFSPLEEKGSTGGATETSNRNKVANYALQFVGNPYVWGGTSLTKGADCSGFTLSVMKNFGVSLPRVSRDQAKAGVAVDSSQKQPGDLIFYADNSGTINHVALYIGNGQVVHASNKRTGIKISTWNYRTPKTIRRVIS